MGKGKRYEKIKLLGEGQFAIVYEAKDKTDDKVVAIKKIKLGSRVEARDGINRTALREIKLLNELKHENVIGLLDVIGHKTNIQLVFDYMLTDLEQVIKDDDILLLPTHIKNIMIQTLTGLEYLHANWILHRDMKPNNLLMNDAGCVKLADFGLARFFGSPTRNYTHHVVTRWYRPPELLMGATNYGVGVDVWASGCILAELLLRAPLFPGESDLDQLVKIVDILGSPTKEVWPLMEELSGFVRIRPAVGIPLDSIFTAAGDDLLALIRGLLRYDPLQRLDCSQALQTAYFSNRPYPSPNDQLPIPGKSMSQRVNLKRNRPVLPSDDGAVPTRKQLKF